MKITISEQGDIVLLSLMGRLNNSTVSHFEDSCHKQLEKGALKIVIDFEALEYANSAGLKQIVLLQQDTAKRGAKLVLCSMHNTLLDAFEIAGFDKLLIICDSQEDAIRSF